MVPQPYLHTIYGDTTHRIPPLLPSYLAATNDAGQFNTFGPCSNVAVKVGPGFDNRHETRRKNALSRRKARPSRRRHKLSK